MIALLPVIGKPFKETYDLGHGRNWIIKTFRRFKSNTLLGLLLTIKAKLKPTEEQRQKLLRTMETFNRACDDISKEAYDPKTFNQYKLHHRLYYRIREQYRLPAQLAIRAIQ